MPVKFGLRRRRAGHWPLTSRAIQGPWQRGLISQRHTSRAGRLYAVIWIGIGVASAAYLCVRGQPAAGAPLLAVDAWLMLLYVRLSLVRSTNHFDIDEQGQRVLVHLKPLCERAGLEVPRLLPRTTPGSNLRVISGRSTRLIFNPDATGLLTDPELDAILAHELSHITGPARVPKWLRIVVVVSIYAAIGLALLIANVAHLGFVGYLGLMQPMLTIVVIGLFTLLRARRRELERAADRGVHAFALEPATLASALKKLYAYALEVRSSIEGPAPIRWLLMPLTRPNLTHPPLAERLKLLGEDTA